METISFFSGFVEPAVMIAGDIFGESREQSTETLIATALSGIACEFTNDATLSNREISLIEPEEFEDYLSGAEEGEEEGSSDVESELCGLETSGEGEENSKRDESDKSISSCSKGKKLLEAIKAGDFNSAIALLQSGAFGELDTTDKQQLIGELLEKENASEFLELLIESSDTKSFF